MLLQLVTGYIPIQGHPRTAKEYGELGEDLFGKVHGNFSILPFYERVEDTWLAKLIRETPFDVTHSVADNPEKNSLAYHCVQHQKFGWLLKAALQDDKPDTFVWVDYGISHVPGVTAGVVSRFMDSIQENDFAIPGCHEKASTVISEFFPCWRFCGGVMVVPRKHILRLYKAVKLAAKKQLQRKRNIEWEVNTLARAEPFIPELRWYQADHNETMFTNYGVK